ncbi:MAG TPA: hypothetical protein VGE47_12230 [Burkholderiaceae bacterium]
MLSIAWTLLIYLLGFVALRQLWPGGILFYQGLALGLLVAACQCLFLRRRGRAWAAATKDGWITFLMIYAFVFTVPTTVDRAYSVRMIEQLDHAQLGLSRDEILRFYAEDFARQGGVDKRLREQLATGTLQEREGRFELTPAGRQLARAFALTRRLFACGQSAGP